MALDAESVQWLHERAKAVGEKIGWRLGFVVAPNPEFAGLVAGPSMVFIVGPDLLSNLVAHEVELTLDALEKGDQLIFSDEDGDPRLGGIT